MESNKTKTILKGSAPIQNQENGVTVSGFITAVSQYFNKESKVNIEHFNPTHSYIGVSNSSINFTGNANMSFSTEVKGSIVQNPLIKDIGINSEKMYVPKELEKRLRFLRRLFADESDYPAVLQKLKDINIKTSGNVQQSNTPNKSKVLLEREHDFAPINFTIQVPLFQGDNTPYRFTVSIYADVTDTGAKLWLEAIDLDHLFETEKEKIILAEIKILERLGFPIIFGVN
ncbi:MAG: hypothetical protein ABI851_16035 [Saprospiraceae bacterium]